MEPTKYRFVGIKNNKYLCMNYTPINAIMIYDL